MADLGLAVRLTLAIIFGWASIGKSRQPGQLSRFLATVGIPRSVSGPLGIVVICAEALVAGGFALSVSFPSFAIPAALAATTLSLCFVGFAARARYVRVQEPCNCFGSSEGRPVGAWVLARATLMFVSSAAALVLPAVAFTPASVLAQLTVAVGIASIVFLADWVVIAYEYLRQPAAVILRPTRRISVRHVPLETSLFSMGVESAPQHIPLVPEPHPNEGQ